MVQSGVILRCSEKDVELSLKDWVSCIQETVRSSIQEAKDRESQGTASTTHAMVGHYNNSVSPSLVVLRGGVPLRAPMSHHLMLSSEEVYLSVSQCLTISCCPQRRRTSSCPNVSPSRVVLGGGVPVRVPMSHHLVLSSEEAYLFVPCPMSSITKMMAESVAKNFQLLFDYVYDDSRWDLTQGPWSSRQHLAAVLYDRHLLHGLLRSLFTQYLTAQSDAAISCSVRITIVRARAHLIGPWSNTMVCVSYIQLPEAFTAANIDAVSSNVAVHGVSSPCSRCSWLYQGSLPIANCDGIPHSKAMRLWSLMLAWFSLSVATFPTALQRCWESSLQTPMRYVVQEWIKQGCIQFHLQRFSQKIITSSITITHNK